MTPSAPARATADPVDPLMRASQAERERTVDLLREHAGEGRLELDELEQRVEAALAARTRGELAALTADLPAGRRPPRPRATGSAVAALVPLVAGIAVLALAPAAFAWVGWTAIGWWFFAGLPSAGLRFGSCAHKRRRARDTVVA